LSLKMTLHFFRIRNQNHVFFKIMFFFHPAGECSRRSAAASPTCVRT
jgi:hypothetical protein